MHERDISVEASMKTHTLNRFLLILSVFIGQGYLWAVSDSDMKFTTTGGGSELTFTDSSNVIVASITSQGDAYFRNLNLTSGGGSYIQNQSTLQSGSQFYVSSASIDGQFLMALNGTDKVGIGISAPQGKLHMTGGDIILDRFGGAGADEIQTRKARGVLGSPTIVNDADDVGGYEMWGYDGTQYVQAANIQPLITGTPGVNQMPTALTFMTNPGSNAVVERVRISSGGLVGIGTTSPLGLLHLEITDPSQRGLVIQRAAGQLANLQEWRSDTPGITPLLVDQIGAISAGPMTGLNQQGLDVTLIGGPGTGSAFSGGILLQTYSSVGGGSTQHSVLQDRVYVEGSGNVGIATTAPTAKLDVNGTARFRGAVQFDAGVPMTGAIRVSTQAVTGTYNVSSTDVTLLANASGGNVTINLPSAAGNSGRILYIKRIDATGNTLSINGNGGDLIDGSSPYNVAGSLPAVTLVCDGVSNWYIIGIF
jgi:hypothetical protein